ncbi:MAG TPA: GNAT family N-acetyltransferase [Phycisphaerales bacterium]|nr:GNAT family N-acetyltransferase [Phycisphaerales bacterium]
MRQLEPIMVARVNERRQARALRELADEAVEVGGGVMCFSRGVPWINHATGVGLASAAGPDELRAVEAFYRERAVQPKIEMTVFATEAFLAHLGERGFVVEHFETVLARALGPGPIDPDGPGRCDGLVIERTDPADPERCRLHSRLVGSGFQTEPLSEAMIEMGVRAIRHPRSLAFMAFVQGEPAGACGMEIFEQEGARACALWGTTVLAPFRRRGIQRALIGHRLAFAAERGCTLAIIESKPGIATERNAARLGFGLAYTRVCMAQRERAQ